MPFGYEETRLWTRSLAARDRDAYSSQRQKLTSAYHNFRERAALVAAEIPQDLREYTVHDVTHLDALWEIAEQISGEDIYLTPTEPSYWAARSLFTIWAWAWQPGRGASSSCKQRRRGQTSSRVASRASSVDQLPVRTSPTRPATPCGGRRRPRYANDTLFAPRSWLSLPGRHRLRAQPTA